MSKAKITLDITKINFSAKMEFLYSNYKDEIKDDLTRNVTKQYKKKQFLYLETKESIYKFMNSTLLNIISKKEYTNDEVLSKLKNNYLIISKNILNKFHCVSEKKLREVITTFVKKCVIVKIDSEHVFLKNNLNEPILSIDYHNNYVENMYLSSNKKDSNFFSIKKDKIIIAQSISKSPSIENFINQFCYLDSCVYNIKKYYKDITENYKEITKEGEKIYVYTSNYIYTIEHYNVVNIAEPNGIVLTKASYIKFLKENIDNVFYNFKPISEYITLKTIKDFYGSLIKAYEYISKLGISIRVITKFTTENNNFKELFDFIISDIVNYGVIQYDNFMTGDMIISTNRFFYLIKEGVVLNILNRNKEEILQCTLPFKPVMDNCNKKDSILDLDINDTLRDYVPIKDILSLIPGKHVIERFTQRIARNNDVFSWGEDIKRDIYKFGTVMLGTYYKDTKLIRGHKYVYVISDKKIISIWQPNEFIDELNKRYFETINNSISVDKIIENYATIIA